METKRPYVLIALLVVAALVASGYSLYSNYLPAEGAELAASGTVEATEITIAPELSGKVSEVLVHEGDRVAAGEVLFRLDDTLLQAQRGMAAGALETTQAAARTAEAAVAAARAQYELALTTALGEQKASRSADWSADQASEYTQPSWYFDKSEQASAAQAEVAAAQSALETAQNKLAAVEEKAAGGDFTEAEQRLMEARSAFEVAQSVLEAGAQAGQDIQDSAQRNYDDALVELDSAQKAFDEVVTTSGAQDVLTARAELRVAQERYDTAQDHLRGLQTGSLSPKVVAAQKALDQASAAAEQAKAATAQAQANLALIDAQIGKLTVTAPADGIVLTRAVEPGEVVMPGSGLLTLARLSDLTITVYVPEDRYGELALGQAAEVRADSFPGETFNGTITNISSRAEFTPRNVQTASGRKTTVFAIQLSLPDAEGKLKPGMPADVVFK